jgi:hypothetical protein
MDIGLFNFSFSLTTFGVCIGWAVLMVIFAKVNGFLTEMQMYDNWEFGQGVPLFDHWGFRSAVVLITPTLSIIVGTYSSLWNAEQLRNSFAGATIISVVMSYIWTMGTKAGLPEAMAIKGHMTIVGFLLTLFMIPTIACFFQFFFCSGITREADLSVSLIVAIHLFVSTHIPLHIKKPWLYPRDPFKDPFTWVVLSVMYSTLLCRYITL